MFNIHQPMIAQNLMHNTVYLVCCQKIYQKGWQKQW